MKPLTAEHVEMLRVILERAPLFNKPPSFQLYVQDWLGSKTILAMTPGQEGGYFRLCCCLWDDERMSLPDDDRKLALMSRIGPEWPTLGGDIRDCFCPHPFDTGRLTSVKLIEIRYYQLLKQSSGQAGGQARSERSDKQPPKQTADEIQPFLSSRLPVFPLPDLPSVHKRSSPSFDGLALATQVYDLIRGTEAKPGTHPNLPTLRKPKETVLASWAKTIDRFLKHTGKTPDELRKFFDWLAQDRQEKRPGSDWVGWWQPFQGPSVLDKDSAWAAFERGGTSSRRVYVPKELRGQG